MATNLFVFTKPTEDPDTFKVFWACGRNTQGVLVVTMTCDIQSKDVAAELSAIQYILETMQVCGKDRAGNAMDITVSFSAIKKLSQTKSDKDYLADYALFLRTRFSDAVIKVSKDESFINPNKSSSNTKRIQINTPQLSAITFPDGFKAAITQHALKAYMVRYQNFVAANAWRALRAAAEDYSTHLQGATSEEQSNHGREILAYVSAEGLRFIVAKEANVAKIVTVYYVPKLDKVKRWAS